MTIDDVMVLTNRVLDELLGSDVETVATKAGGRVAEAYDDVIDALQELWDVLKSEGEKQ